MGYVAEEVTCAASADCDVFGLWSDCGCCCVECYAELAE